MKYKNSNLAKTEIKSLALSFGLFTSAHAVTIASDDFSSGATSGGSGWDNNWQIGGNGGGGGAVTLNASTSPLGGNGDYANITGTGNNNTRGAHRNYTSALTNIGDEHTISFLFRIDDLPVATGDPSRGLVTHGATSFGSCANST